MDYRNLPFKFGYGGLNVVSSPEMLRPGQYSYFQNVRYRREGTLEARPGTEIFERKFTQATVTGGDYVYPLNWNIGRMQKCAYIGKIYTTSNAEIDGYVFFHNTGAGSNNPTAYTTFINGTPIAKGTTAYALTTPFQTTGFSVVRTVAKSGIPITILDGTHYVINNECNIATPPFAVSYNIGLSAGYVPVFLAYSCGITAPATAPTVAASSATGLLSGDYYYAYSYYNSKTGFESPLSPASTIDTITTKKGELLDVVQSQDPQVDRIRIWRKGGTISNSWRLVSTDSGAGALAAQVNNPAAAGVDFATTLTDNTADSVIALNEKFDTDLIVPFSSVNSAGSTITAQDFKQCWGPFQGKFCFWVGDTIKKGYVYWTEENDISRYDPLTSLSAVSDPGEELQNGFMFSSQPFIFSKLNLYALDYGGPDALPAFTPRLVNIGVGMAGKHCFAVGSNAVYFVGRDGIYATNCQPGKPVNLSEDTIKTIFQGTTVNGLAPINWSYNDYMRMAVTSKELHFFYIDSNTVQRHLVMDLERAAWSEWTSGKYQNGYADEASLASRLVFGANSSGSVDVQTYCVDDSRPTSGTETFTVKVRSGSLDNGIPLTYKEYGALQIDGNYASIPITVTPYYDSEVTAGTAILLTATSGDTRRDYPYTLGDVYGRSFALDITWQEAPSAHPILYQGNLLFRDEEERLMHWELQPTSLGIGGWYHLKDGYICIRSDSVVNLTVVIDGTTTDIYPIASTGGLRLKRYVEFKARRGKVFQFKLDAVADATIGAVYKPFRFYGEESLVNGKPWITGATYAPLTPFGAVGYAQYRRTEGGT